jgi:hypothetical protein
MSEDYLCPWFESSFSERAKKYVFLSLLHLILQILNRISLRITGFLDFAHHPVFKRIEHFGN